MWEPHPIYLDIKKLPNDVNMYLCVWFILIKVWHSYAKTKPKILLEEKYIYNY